jgi:hypothetical protein
MFGTYAKGNDQIDFLMGPDDADDRKANARLQKRLGVTAELRLLRGAVGPSCRLNRSVTRLPH